MLTYLVRHARTSYSAAYRVNGRPELGVAIDDVGYGQCCTARARFPGEGLATCVTSHFPRAVQTADLLLTGKIVPRYVDARLGEIDYGVFEGRAFLEYGHWLEEHGAWQRPPGSSESQREAIRRMLAGLRGALRWSGPRLVVAHGLLVSVIQQGAISGIYFPEAPYVTPIQLPDDDMQRLVANLANEIDREGADRGPEGRVGHISADAERRTC